MFQEINDSQFVLYYIVLYPFHSKIRENTAVPFRFHALSQAYAKAMKFKVRVSPQGFSEIRTQLFRSNPRCLVKKTMGLDRKTGPQDPWLHELTWGHGATLCPWMVSFDRRDVSILYCIRKIQTSLNRFKLS